MRQLLPHPAEDVDPFAAYAVDRPRPEGRPWVTSLFVSTADGAASVGGVSGSLGGEGDRAVFRAVRAVADIVVVGAGTARTEDYGPVRAAADAADARRARGQAPHPRLVVVTASLGLDPDQRLFAEADGTTEPPLVIHPSDAPAEARRRLDGVAELVETSPGGEGGVTVEALMAELHRRGTEVAVCEGGPTLNGHLVAADAVDELCLTLDPRVVGGDAPRIAHDPGQPVARGWTGAHLLEQDGALFWRLVRDRSAG
ncbi:bifunctional diaminohydroxyphosphoribosylaminopyrimidine deaminase/5-amino-6-(5-phosphoribosylamino)uracil reductase [soil metagenome]